MFICKNTRIAFLLGVLLCDFGLGFGYGVGIPTGHSDIGLTLKNTAVEVPVLLNDLAASAGVLQVAGIASQAQNGVVTHTLDGIVYTPNTDFVGIDSFTYTLVESLEGELSSGVPVVVEIAVNTPLDMEATRDCYALFSRVAPYVELRSSSRTLRGDKFRLHRMAEKAGFEPAEPF